MAKVYNPYPYQKYAQDRIIDTPAIGLFLDMGLGKTVITLTALNELKFWHWAVNKILIIAPKKVAEDTWQLEARKWKHLQHLRVVAVLGSAAERVAALQTPADIYVINRENTQWLVEHFGPRWPFDTVVLDESSSFKNHQAKRFRALRSVRPKINRLIELTGTPNPHGLMDLWSQVFLLDGGQRLGRTISVYRDLYFVPDKRNRTTIFSYAPKDGAESEIHKRISDICISMKSEDYLDLPEMVYEDIPVVLDDKALRAYQRLERDAILQVDEETITANTAAGLSGKLLQLCNGAVYDEDHNVIPVHDCKIEAFMETVEGLHGQHALVCYYFNHDRDRLLQKLSQTNLRVRVYKDTQDKYDWNAGLIDLMLIHPASCGYGLNLQEGGHHIIWYGLTWNLEEYQQANKRLHRQGQAHPVIVHHLLVRGGRDEDVIESLECKDDVQESLLQSLKVRIKGVKGIA